MTFRGRRGLADRLSAMLGGPYPALPRPLDALAEGWARLQPRVRLLVGAALVLAAVAAVQARIDAADRRWGGTPTPVLVAARDLPVGAPPTDLRQVEFPPAVVPAGAVGHVPADAVLALALPEGGVLTAAHLDTRGPGAGLPAELRAVPVPVEDGWGVVAGGWVDVWALDVGEEPAALVARSRPVLEVRDDDLAATALLGLHVDEVGPATAGLATGGVLLTHAPPPATAPPEEASAQAPESGPP